MKIQITFLSNLIVENQEKKKKKIQFEKYSICDGDATIRRPLMHPLVDL